MGNKIGSKRTSTLIREMFEGELKHITNDNLPRIMKQLALDASNEDLEYMQRHKARQLLLQYVDKTADRDIEQDKRAHVQEPVQIEVSRDGVLIQSRGQSVRVNTDGNQCREVHGNTYRSSERGGGLEAEGDDGEVVPYMPHATDQFSNIPHTTNQIPQNPNTAFANIPDTDYNFHGQVIKVPGTDIPYSQFVGPHHQLNRDFTIPRAEFDPFFSHHHGFDEWYGLDRPVEMNFNFEVINHD
jgi:hypothetical protein